MGRNEEAKSSSAKESHSGIVVLDKPAGMTSQQAVSRVKRLLGVKKAGHSGSLDPAVTGVLPVLFGKATRLAEYVQELAKEYEAIARFGWSTDTQDGSGSVLAVGDASNLSCEAIGVALSEFVGDIKQVPPQYSALHVDGMRAYELARRGLVADLKARPVRIDWIELLSCERDSQGSVFARFRIACGKGTYVRTICHDLGSLLGVPAHMASLVRLRSGPFGIEEAHGLAELEQDPRPFILSMEAAVQHLPFVQIDEITAHKVTHGSSFETNVGMLGSYHGDIRVNGPDGALLAIYAWDGVVQKGTGTVTARKVLAAQEEML